MNETRNIPAVTVVGAGLAGSEAALQLARFGLSVRLIDMKPKAFSPAHSNPDFAELVCSNSFRAASLENAVGLLKEELRRLGSVLMKLADEHRVPAGGALAVDRQGFSKAVTSALKSNPLINVETGQVDAIPAAGPTIIATGPLTAGALFDDIADSLGWEHLHFFDAAAPIVTAESLDRNIVFRQSRYDKGGADYLNCPMKKEEYEAFWEALTTAEVVPMGGTDTPKVFEGCMPVETMAKRGRETLLFGPLKPVGLIDPRTGKRPYAVVQLRQDDRAAELYNIVGFQTRLKFPEQKRVFGMIPGLAEADFVRYGVMHRNTYLNSPRHLLPSYAVRGREDLYFAGQITGVEGYVESISSGLVAALHCAATLKGVNSPPVPSAETVIGSLAHYVSDSAVENFQPMNANFGLLAPLAEKIKNKKMRNQAYGQRSLAEVDDLAAEMEAWVES